MMMMMMMMMMRVRNCRTVRFGARIGRTSLQKATVVICLLSPCLLHFSLRRCSTNMSKAAGHMKYLVITYFRVPAQTYDTCLTPRILRGNLAHSKSLTLPPHLEMK